VTARRLIALLAAVLAVAMLPAAASASPTQESTFQDDNQLIFSPPAAVAATLDRLQALGVDRLRVSVFWATVAPGAQQQTRPAFDATDPAAYPASAWDRYDTLVRLAAARGLRVNFNVTSPAPAWATGSLPGRPDLDITFAPDPAEFAAFVTAAGRRYSGTYAPAGGATVPRVAYWTVWNEPNQPGWLTPQWVDDPSGPVEAAPRIYRGLVDAMWGALQATGHGRDTILVGETAPKGQARAKGPTRAIKPGRFVRQLYCLDDHLQFLRGHAAEVRGCPTADQAKAFAAAHPALFAATGYAHHPYEVSFAPNRVPTSADDLTTANLSVLSALLRRVYQRYGRAIPGGRRDVPLYLTEYGYQTDPPDPTGVTRAQQAAYLDQAEYLTWANPRVRTLTQFLLVDDKPIAGASPLEAYGATFQSGLLTLDGKAKPALRAYRLPLVLPRSTVRAGRRLRVWGLVREAANGTAPVVQVQVRASTRGAAFRTVRTVRGTAARGYVDTTVAVRRSGLVRLVFDAPAGAQTSRPVAFRVR
jgi:hypothetical protein